MKRILTLAAFAAIILSACAKVETIKVNENDGTIPVSFTSYTPRAITKANTGSFVDGTTNSNLINGTTFGVYAWAVVNTTTPWSVNNNRFDGTGTPNFMSNIPITFKGATAGADGSANVSAAGLYSAGNPVRYWPSGDTPSGLSFYAYYPAGGTGISMPANGLGATTFTAETVAANQIDFMVAPVVADQYYGHTNSSYEGGAKGTVDFTFKHTLTKVRFYFKTDNDDANTTVKLVGARLSGVNKTNTLTTSYTEGTTANGGTFAYDWGEASVPANFDVYINGVTPAPSSNEITLSTTATTCTLGDNFLMVPQTIAAGAQKLTVSWTVQTGSGAVVTNTKTIDLYNIKDSSSNVIQWTKNLQVAYTIVVGPKPIYFTAAVTGWDDTEKTGEFTVN